MCPSDGGTGSAVAISISGGDQGRQWLQGCADAVQHRDALLATTSNNDSAVATRGSMFQEGLEMPELLARKALAMNVVSQSYVQKVYRRY